jgi:hypothetical protein
LIEFAGCDDATLLASFSGRSRSHSRANVFHWTVIAHPGVSVRRGTDSRRCPATVHSPPLVDVAGCRRYRDRSSS